jgi:predicted glycosyltransferase
MNVLIVVTHLLGSGHLSRALTLGRAFADQGHSTTIASGGMPVPQFDTVGLTFVQLPPLCSDGTDFTRLLTDTGTKADDAYLAQRRTALCDAVTTIKPDILITELYPFGRRVLRHEFLALLATATALAHPPVILSSIRDILAPPSKPDRAHAADDIIARYYDGVLVHSDPRSTALDQSWPVSDMLRARLHYTGYVAPPPARPHPENAGNGEVLVSAGGGGVGDALFETAIAAARINRDLPWRLLVGGTDAQARVARLRTLAGEIPITIEPARPDFRQMLYLARCSVSMCGYNTALDLLQSGTPSVLVPFDDGAEVEQTLRAQSLAHLDGFQVLKSTHLTAAALLSAIKAAQSNPRPAGAGLNFDGASVAVKIAQTLHEDRP